MAKYSIFIFIALVVFLFILNIFFGLHNIVFASSSSLLKRFSTIVVNTGNLLQVGDIKEERDNLLEEKWHVLAQSAEIEQLKKENLVLREQLGVSNKTSYKIDVVNVFNPSYEEITATAYINKGMEDGIEKGMPVIVGRNILMGITSEVFSRYSKILLVTDRRVKIGSLNSAGKRFLAIGAAGDGILLDFVSSADEVAEEDTIFTEESEYIPGLLVIGEIESFSYNPSDLFKKVFVRPAFQSIDFSTGFIIKDF